MEGLRLAILSLHTSPGDQPGSGDAGGMNVYVRNVASELVARGAIVDVYTRCAGREVPEIELVGPGLRVIQAQAGPCARVDKDDLDELLPRFVLSILRHEPPPYDLIHSHYWLSGRAGLALRERWDAPLVASFHTLAAVKEADGFAEPEARFRGERAVVAGADRLVAATPDEAASLAHLYDGEPNRIRVVPPGVDLSRFTPAHPVENRSPIVLFVGRLDELKGVDVAMRAVARLAGATEPSVRGVHLRIAGADARGDAAPSSLRAEAERLGIAERVGFLGAFPNEHLPALYRSADLVVAPSRSEAFGLAALEAQACGVPVVASSVGGLRTIVEDGITGALVEPGDDRALAESMGRLLASPSLRAVMGRRARARAEGFSWDDTVDGLLGVYEELLGASEAVAGG